MHVIIYNDTKNLKQTATITIKNQLIIRSKVIKMTKRTMSICCAILILVLMITPFGVRMVFFGGVSESTSQTETQFKSFFGTVSGDFIEMLPFGSSGDTITVEQNETISFYFSYFSSMPIGYGNWYPLITALLTVILLVLLLIGLKRDVRTLVGILAIGSILASALSWVIFSAFSIVGFCIFALHIIICIFQIEKKSQKIVTTPETELWKMK